MRKWSLSFALLALIWACGSDALVEDDAPASYMEQQLFIIPSGYDTDDFYLYAAGDSIFLDLDRNYKFVVGNYVNGQTPTDFSKSYASVVWELDGEDFNIGSFQHTFQTPGEKKGYVKTVDFYGDSSRTDFTIFIDTPNSITLSSPYNGYNQVERDSNLQVPLRWTTTGIDPWEKATCYVYVSDYKDSLWINPLAVANCNKELSIVNVVDFDQDYNTIYWGVVMDVSSLSGRHYIDTSAIFNFTTKTPHKDFSWLTIPIKYQQLRGNRLVRTQITLVNTNGDTLKQIYNTDSENALTVSVEPQSNLKIFAQEMYQAEYTVDSLTIDIPESSAVFVDTLVFKDHTSPQLAPVAGNVAVGDSIQFFAYDDGAGINPNKIMVVVGNDTIPHEFSEPLLSFESNCSLACKIQIFGEDYAHNPFPKVFWRVEHKHSGLVLSGPYSDKAD